MVLFFNGSPSITPRNRAQDEGGGGSNDLLNGLVAYWTMDEASGTRADSHTGGHDLNDINTVGSTTGVQSNAADFVSANNELFDAANHADLRMGEIDFTIALWMQLDSIAAAKTILVKAGFGYGYRLWFDASTNFNFATYGSGATNLVTSSASLSAATWHFVVIWQDTTADKVFIRIDDTTEDEAARAGAADVGINPLRIGAFASGSQNIDGQLDEVGFWKRLLTTSEITDLYNSGNGRTYSYFESA